MLGQNHLDFEKLSYFTAFMQKNEKIPFFKVVKNIWQTHFFRR